MQMQRYSKKNCWNKGKLSVFEEETRNLLSHPRIMIKSRLWYLFTDTTRQQKLNRVWSCLVTPGQSTAQSKRPGASMTQRSTDANRALWLVTSQRRNSYVVDGEVETRHPTRERFENTTGNDPVILMVLNRRLSTSCSPEIIIGRWSVCVEGGCFRCANQLSTL